MRLLDTDTCVALLRGVGHVGERLEAAAPHGVVTTWVTAGELAYGAACSADPEGNAARADAFLATLPVLAPDAASARWFGAVKAALRRRGELLPDAELWIASLALAHGAVVVTGNTRHLGRVPGVRTEDWIR